MVLTVVALVLFTRDRISLETSSMVAIAALTVGFELFPYHGNGTTLHAVEFFHGFGHEALVAVCALMIVGPGLVRTGALEPLGRVLALMWRAGPTSAMLFTLTVAAVLSAFVNNTPIAVLLPVLINVSLRSRSSPTGVLMPMGLATLIGGASTTIDTSTSLLVASAAADIGLRSMGIFDSIATAAMAGAVGILFLVFVAHCLNCRGAAGALNTQVILIVVACLGLGLALLRTGGADYPARVFAATTFGAPPLVVLGGLTLLLGILTNLVSSNAAAVLGTPIAVSAAQQIGQPPEAFVRAVMFGVKRCHVTPLAHKTSVLVMAAGGCTFSDFVRVGLPLALMMWIACTAALSLIYGV
jgi:di/tricarboxylate transporter